MSELAHSTRRQIIVSQMVQSKRKNRKLSHKYRKLRKQVKAKENKISVLSVKSTSDLLREPMTQSSSCKAALSHKPVPVKVQSPKESDEYFCY